MSEKLVQRLDKDSLRLGHPVVTITQVRMYIRGGFQFLTFPMLRLLSPKANIFENLLIAVILLL